MKAQEIFDRVYDHLVAQGKQSKTESGGCLYRDFHGNRCAIGALISDEDWAQYNVAEVNGDSIEGLPTALQEKLFPEDLSGVRLWTEDDVPVVPRYDFLVSLQGVHDHDQNWSSEGFIGHDSMREVAKEYGLTFRQR